MSLATRAPLTRFERMALAAALLLVVLLSWPLRHYQTDDTFIHLQYARRLIQGEGLVFNAGERVYGCTSPLWATLLAGAMALRVDGLWAAHALGLLFALASVLLYFRLLQRTLATPAVRGLATLAWAGHAWMLRWSLSGMETPLATALTLAGFVAWAGPVAPRRIALAGVLWALGALARPEVALLLALWGALSLADREVAPSPWQRLTAIAPGLLIYGGWLAFAWGYYGTPLPQTLAAKTAGAVGLEFFLSNEWRQARIVAATDGLLALVLVAALFATRGEALSAGRTGPLRALPWAFLLGVPALYAVRGVPVISRYLVPLLPVLGWLAWSAVEGWWVGREADPARRRRAAALAALLAALVLAQNLAVYTHDVVPHVRSFSAGLEQSLVRWGRWFGAHAPRDAAIAAPDIGALGYYSGLRVVDLAGLVTPAMIPLLEREPGEDIVTHLRFAAVARPEFVVDRAPAPNDLTRRSRYGPCLTPLGHASVPNLGIARPGEAVYTFYRVEWACYDALNPARGTPP